MTALVCHTNLSDQARTGTIVFSDGEGGTIAISPCWLPEQSSGFVRMSIRRGLFHWEDVYDY